MQSDGRSAARRSAAAEHYLGQRLRDGPHALAEKQHHSAVRLPCTCKQHIAIIPLMRQCVCHVFLCCELMPKVARNICANLGSGVFSVLWLHNILADMQPGQALRWRSTHASDVCFSRVGRSLGISSNFIGGAEVVMIWAGALSSTSIPLIRLVGWPFPDELSSVDTMMVFPAVFHHAREPPGPTSGLSQLVTAWALRICDGPPQPLPLTPRCTTCGMDHLSYIGGPFQAPSDKVPCRIRRHIPLSRPRKSSRTEVALRPRPRAFSNTLARAKA